MNNNKETELFERYLKAKGIEPSKLGNLNKKSLFDNYIEATDCTRKTIQKRSEVRSDKQKMIQDAKIEAKNILIETLKELLEQ